jgi:hypothetical protein
MLVFVHIPKTAGTTLHKIITHQYPARKILIRHDSDGPWSEEELRRLQGRDKPQVVMGHLSVGLHEKIEGVRYITCLREPVSRVVSLYYHAKNDPTHYLHGPIASGSLTITEYASSALSGELSDGMTRMLAGAKDFHEGIVDHETLELAKKNLEQYFDGVIFEDTFDESLMQIAGRLGWTTPYYIRRKVGRYDHDRVNLGESDRETILGKNRHDQALYEWARQHFQPVPPEMNQISILNPTTFRESNRRFGWPVYLGRELRRRMFKL